MNKTITTKEMIKTALLFVFSVSIFACTPDKIIHTPDIDSEEGVQLDLSIIIPPGGNSWVISDVAENESVISDSGIHNWNNLNSVIRTYFKTTISGDLHVGLKIKSPDGKSTIKVTVGDTTKEVKINNTDYKVVEIGVFKIAAAGYNFIEIQGLEKEGANIGDISEILVGGPATSGKVFFVKDDFHFGRRGPSVHLSYSLPEGKDITWFYNEVTVPEGEDVVGSYFMANGFNQGYFGMQVNSATEKRILFSVWSPYVTDNPGEIPEDYKIELLGKGEGVTSNAFGGEGSGGQSYKVFDWQAGNTYKFLLKGEPSVNNSTDYTAYFYAPETSEWILIASFRRPHTTTHLKGFYSFLENFRTDTGFISRKGQYANQWVNDTQGNWHELTNAKFTADATAKKEARLDYEGGLVNNSFYMRNCGFFNEGTLIGSEFSRTANGIVPNIDFSSLPAPVVTPEVTLFDKTAWVITDFSTQEDQGGEGTTGLASDILDEDISTYWHSCWNGCTALAPHHITVDMGQLNTINGFRFSQRQSLSRAVENIEIQISIDNINWESVGDFVLENVANPQNVDLSESKTLRYFKFIAKSSHDGSDNSAIADINVYTFQ
ncbi:MAG: DUF3472 domain-containing protein [Cellulophaga sp.]